MLASWPHQPHSFAVLVLILLRRPTSKRIENEGGVPSLESGEHWLRGPWRRMTIPTDTIRHLESKTPTTSSSWMTHFVRWQLTLPATAGHNLDALQTSEGKSNAWTAGELFLDEARFLEQPGARGCHRVGKKNGHQVLEPSSAC